MDTDVDSDRMQLGASSNKHAVSQRKHVVKKELWDPLADSVPKTQMSYLEVS